MKIRIKGNSVRLRLSKPEVEKLSIENPLQEHSYFASNTFSYVLKVVTNGSDLGVDFEHGTITMTVPGSLIKDWPKNEIVGFNTTIETPGREPLKLVLEKDFKCLDNSTEDQTDNYVNPNQIC